MLEYTYTYKGGKFTFQGKDSESLWENVKVFLDRQNIKYDEGLIRNHIKLTCKNSDFRQKEQKQPKVYAKPRLRGAFEAAKALVNLSVGNAVDQPEAQRRADICIKCPMKSATSDCMACGGAGVVARQVGDIHRMMKGKTVVPKSVKTLYCGICNCSLSLLVVTKISGLSSKLDNPGRPDECWMKRNGVNFKDN